MEVDEENPVTTTSTADTSTVVTLEDQTVSVGSDNNPIGPVQLHPSTSPLISTTTVPTIAPIPRPLAPLPVRPPVPRQPTPQNGELKASDSDSDHDEAVVKRAGKEPEAEYEISEESRLVRERQERVKQEFLMKQRAAVLAVPTNDMSVRTRLRRLGEPITLFGEREMERRDRLRMLMAKLDAEGQLERLMKAHEEEEAALYATTDAADEEMVQYPFYTEGSRELLEARLDIAKYSIVRAASRLQRAKRKRDDPDEDVDAEMDWVLKQVGSLALDCSEMGDDRPLSGCSFSRDGKLLATWYLILSLCLLP